MLSLYDRAVKQRKRVLFVCTSRSWVNALFVLTTPIHPLNKLRVLRGQRAFYSTREREKWKSLSVSSSFRSCNVQVFHLNVLLVTSAVVRNYAALSLLQMQRAGQVCYELSKS